MAAVSTITGSMQTAFGIMVVVFFAMGAVISIVDLLLTKEKYMVEQEKDAALVKLTDIFSLLRDNDALRVRILGALFGGFMWTLVFATMNYYTKWTYCTDLPTGQVNSEVYGIMVFISSMMMFTPLILGTVTATSLMKKLGSPLKLMKFRFSRRMRCFGYRKGNRFRLLRIERDHKKSDKG